MPEENNRKKCFVITPVGPEDSDIRKRTDDIWRLIIEPTLKEKCGYHIIRADLAQFPGMITPQICDWLSTCDLVVADLTGSNTNVGYELAICHFLNKPVISIVELGQTPPSDLSGIRYISVDHQGASSVDAAKTMITQMVQAIEDKKEPVVHQNPLTYLLGRAAQDLVTLYGGIHIQSGRPNTVEEVVRLYESATKSINVISWKEFRTRATDPAGEKYLKSLKTFLLKNPSVEYRRILWTPDHLRLEASWFEEYDSYHNTEFKYFDTRKSQGKELPILPCVIVDEKIVNFGWGFLGRPEIDESNITVTVKRQLLLPVDDN